MRCCVRSSLNFLVNVVLWFRRLIPSDSLLTSSIKSREISPELCDALSLLKERFDILHKALNRTLFSKIWKKLAYVLNQFIYENIILQQYFSLEGLNFSFSSSDISFINHLSNVHFFLLNFQELNSLLMIRMSSFCYLNNISIMQNNISKSTLYYSFFIDWSLHVFYHSFHTSRL
jgi:hypothetical protein